MSIETFVPKVWSARILESLDKTLVYANLFNRNYEGEIAAYGDTVHINSVGDVTVKTYTKDTDIADPDTLTTTESLLVIDQAKYFNIGIDDVDKAQARAELLQTAAARVGYSYGDIIDKWLASLLKAGTIVKDLGTDATPLQVTEANAYNYMVNMKTALDKANVPTMGRGIVVPPEFEGYMLLDSRFASSSDASNERLVNGVVARAAGFDIYVSNNVPNTSGAKYKIIATTADQGTFAQQVLETEAYRPQKRFGDAVKGLNVYGAKVLRPETIAVATVNFGAAGA